MTRQPVVVDRFVCPDCLLSLDTSSLLQEHWIQHHSSHKVACQPHRLERNIHESAAFVQFPVPGCLSGNQIINELSKQKYKKLCAGGGDQVRMIFWYWPIDVYLICTRKFLSSPGRMLRFEKEYWISAISIFSCSTEFHAAELNSLPTHSCDFHTSYTATRQQVHSF